MNMPRPKPDVELVQVLIRLHPDSIAMLDERRGEQSRPQMIATVINAWLADQLPPVSAEAAGRIMRELEAKASWADIGHEPVRPAGYPVAEAPLRVSIVKPEQVWAAHPAKLTMADVRPKFEPRLKKPKGEK